MPPRGRDKGYKGTPVVKKPTYKPTPAPAAQSRRFGKGYQGRLPQEETQPVMTTRRYADVPIPAERTASEYQQTPWMYRPVPNPAQGRNYLQWLSAGGDRPPGMGEMYRYPREPQSYYPYANPYLPPGSNPELDIRNTAVQDYMQGFAANNFRGRGPDKGYRGTKAAGSEQYITMDNYLKIPGFNVPMTDANGNIIGDTGFGPFGPPVPEATGTVESPPQGNYETGAGYYPGYYVGGGGGGYTYPEYPNYWTQYKQGYAMQPTPAERTPELRGVAEPQRYGNYASQNQAARWIQLLTNWRI